MADAYKVLADVTLPRALAQIGEQPDGTPIYEHEGILYPQGAYVLAKDISPTVRERIDNGELDSLVEEASLDDAQEYLNEINGVPRGTFVPEHEVEHEALLDAGHKVVDREEKIKLKAAGADAVREAQEEALSDGADERNVTIEPVPSTNEASENGDLIVTRRKDAEDQYVSAEEAGEIQTDPTGQTAEIKDAPKRRAPRRAPKSSSSQEDSE